LIGWICAVGDDLRAPLTGGSSLLNKPTAIVADAAGRKSVGNGRHQLNQSRGQLAVFTIEMTASRLLTRRGEA
jgi:hypothetical protein